MNEWHCCKWCVLGTLLALVASFGISKVAAAPPAPPAPPTPGTAEQGGQVLTRGPVHEAFAETVTYDPQPGIVAPKAPPAAIEEVPPGQRPEGANVAWIPGYWGWDNERSDFLWISGVWRDLPPGRQWVPGYWGSSGQGFQWTSGYWADAQVSESQYLPEPPATVEAGPNIAAPLADQVWLPGCWVWQNGRYAWRPGFWANAQPNWAWVPAHYVWAPRGYVYVDGYWDHSIDRRGVLFAPVYLDAGVYGRPGFSYSPAIVIDLGLLAGQLFLRPQYQHYYFGDYYAANYQAAGFYPSYSYNAGRYGYDPIFAYDRWQHRQDRGWQQRQQADFQARRDHVELRPPRTWAAQRALGASAGQPGGRSLAVAMPLDELARSKSSPLRFQPVNQVERQRLAQQAQDVQRFGQQRQKLEANMAGAPAATRTTEFAPAKVRLPGSPIVAKPGANPAMERAGPKAYAAPKADLSVVAKPREARPVDQPRAQPQPAPRIERAAPAPQRQSPVERAAPAPQRQPPIERAAPPSAGPNQGKDKDKK